MRSITRWRAGASLLLGLLALGTQGLVLMEYAAMYAHVRSWEMPGASWNTSQGAFFALTGPIPAAIFAAVIGVGLGLSRTALGFVRDRTPADRMGLSGAAARFAGLGLMVGAANAAGLIGVLSYRRYLLAW